MTPTFRITDEETSETIEYSLLKFPAGELQVTLTNTGINPGADVTIKGSILSSDQVFELLQLVEVLRNDGYADLYLDMPYCAYSRQDRRCNYGESFSLKVFTTIINSCEFKRVTTFDNHSDVATALLDNCRNLPVHELMYGEAELNLRQYTALVSPDAGANKKVFECSKLFNIPMIRADKTRDTKTGRILGTEVYTKAEDIKDKRVLIIDDICEGGRTFVELAKALKAVEPSVTIDLYVTHGFFSKGIQVLKDAGISNIITTDSVRDIAEPGLDLVEIKDY